MIRRILDSCYLASGALGALSMVLLGAMVLAQVLGRLTQYQIRGTDDFTAWLMAAGASFSLAYTFRHNAHIRVSLLLERLKGRWRHVLEVLCLVVAAATTGLFTWAAFDLVYSSWTYHEIASGLVRAPLWIPQTVMAIGTLMLLIAVVDDLVMLLAGRRTSYQQASTEKEADASAMEQVIEEL